MVGKGGGGGGAILMAVARVRAAPRGGGEGRAARPPCVN